ncbi:MAG: hypothetical protein AMQ74_01876 [Candidatus Methanofastidiosum methylothiophilum]|uniref:Uncharacterized protein n=1 Tax=Candidatus Methanofastidiosum methylothiophilum TaxID=1705564 RepID=A0A150IM30_9EURY|nr:MAG: hypothetical protein AMQ74_01876 [Candidatus Methanofastidiosum methylthiophilus]
MSGGYWGYKDIGMVETLKEIGDSIKNDYSLLSAMLTGLAKELEDITHRMDWDYSCDSSIDDKVAFEIESVHRILNAVDIQDVIKDKE